MTEKFQFEKALLDLEKIVEALEGGELTLDESLKQYEDGVKLTRACQSKLQEAEKKIEILTRSLSGELKAVPFDAETFEEDSAAKKRVNNASEPSAQPAKKISAKKKFSSDDELI